MERPTALVLGLGNELISDDGFGPGVAEGCQGALAGHPEVAVEWAAAAGLRLLDLLAGYRRCLLVDVVQTGRYPPGTLLWWPKTASGRARTLGGSHQADLATVLGLGKALGYELPSELLLLVAEAEDLQTIRESLTPALSAALPRAVEVVVGCILGRDGFSADWGNDDEEARVVS
jgi:hydrogenase maturation protease